MIDLWYTISMESVTTLKAVFGILASIFVFLGFLPYLRDIKRKRAKPHILSWTGWGFVTGLGAVAMYSEGFTWGVTLVGANSVLCFAIAAFAAMTKVGVWQRTIFDYLFFILGFVGIALWQAFSNPDLAIIFAILADLSFGIPTLTKIYRNPKSETIFPWVMAGLSGLSGVLAVSYISFTEVAYPIYIFLFDSSTLFLIVYFRKIMKTDL